MVRNVASVSTTICMPQTSKRVLLSFATADTSPETRRCRWMRGEVAMHDAPCPTSIRRNNREFGTERLPRQGNRRRRWTGRDCGRTSSSPAKGPPTASSLRFGRPIGAHHTRRNVDTQLHRKKLYAVPFLHRVDCDRH